jgi:hypothetical protein
VAAPGSVPTLPGLARGTPIPAATIVKIAAHVRYTATAKPAVKFPFQLTRLPASWRLLSVVAFGGVTGVFLHHLHLLGADPANWTTRPIG